MLPASQIPARNMALFNDYSRGVLTALIGAFDAFKQSDAVNADVFLDISGKFGVQEFGSVLQPEAGNFQYIPLGGTNGVTESSNSFTGGESILYLAYTIPGLAAYFAALFDGVEVPNWNTAPILYNPDGSVSGGGGAAAPCAWLEKYGHLAGSGVCMTLLPATV